MALVRETELILRRSVPAQWGCAESKANDRGNRGYRRDIRMAGQGRKGSNWTDVQGRGDTKDSDGVEVAVLSKFGG